MRQLGYVTKDDLRARMYKEGRGHMDARYASEFRLLTNFDEYDKASNDGKLSLQERAD